MKNIGCPYRASNNGQCTHKGTSSNRKGKRYCNYGDPNDCILFVEWDEIKISIDNIIKNDFSRRNTSKIDIGEMG